MVVEEGSEKALQGCQTWSSDKAEWGRISLGGGLRAGRAADRLAPKMTPLLQGCQTSRKQRKGGMIAGRAGRG